MNYRNGDVKTTLDESIARRLAYSAGIYCLVVKLPAIAAALSLATARAETTTAANAESCTETES
jgi:hypothetical protein